MIGRVLPLFLLCPHPHREGREHTWRQQLTQVFFPLAAAALAAACIKYRYHPEGGGAGGRRRRAREKRRLRDSSSIIRRVCHRTGPAPSEKTAEIFFCGDGEKRSHRPEKNRN